MKVLRLIILCLYLPGIKAQSQEDSAASKQAILKEFMRSQDSLMHPAFVLRFYDHLQYETIWARDTLQCRQWITLIGNAAQYGLPTASYSKKLSDIERPFFSSTGNIGWDLRFTDLCISFLSDFLYGTPPSNIAYTGLSVKQDCYDIPLLLASSLESKDIILWLDSIDNKSQAYLSLKKELAFFVKQPDSLNANQQQALFTTVNTVRWLHCLQQSSKVIVVNIPSATLEVFDHDSVAMDCKVIAGKYSTPTPTLTSNITQVVLYPYWMVPHKIASRELLPLIKKHPSYLEQNNFQVLDQFGRITDPSTINWQSFNANYFPFTLRQSTGCDNSLGLIKLEFYNPYNVYLHDTPWKLLFLLPQRFFSHGCIRVEKAKELARLLLHSNTKTFDDLITDNPPVEHDPVYIKLPSSIPVVVLYNTAWPDSSGVVRYYKDIYGKMKRNK